MVVFSGAREAKEFLVSQIVAEAKREGVSFSEVERKMLYFSEGYWTLPDMMDVSDEFDSQYDQNEYENKIAALVRNAIERIRKENPEEYQSWLGAEGVLSKEDHYILVMLAKAGICSRYSGPRPRGDFLKLVATALAVVAIPSFGFFVVSEYHLIWQRVFWPTVAGLLLIYGLLQIFLGRQRTGKLLGRVFGFILGVPNRTSG